MEDSKIIDLYWARSQQAIAASEEKYGPYCHTIARRILDREEDAEECVTPAAGDTVRLFWQADQEPVPGPVAAAEGGQAGRQPGGGGPPRAGGLPA